MNKRNMLLYIPAVIIGILCGILIEGFWLSVLWSSVLSGVWAIIFQLIFPEKPEDFPDDKVE